MVSFFFSAAFGLAPKLLVVVLDTDWILKSVAPGLVVELENKVLFVVVAIVEDT